MRALKERYAMEVPIKEALKHQIKKIEEYIKANHVEPKRIPERDQVDDLTLYNFEGERDLFEDVDIVET